jgi:hypothetical protein
MCIFEWLQPFNANSSQPLAEAGVFFAYYDKAHFPHKHSHCPGTDNG